MRIFHTASIREEDCVGCSKCLEVCPVDAIIGTHRYSHTILSSACIGCGLCLPPCPVDCIEVTELSAPLFDPEQAKARHITRKLRLSQQAQLALAPPPEAISLTARKAVIAEAIARKKAAKVDISSEDHRL